MKQIINRIKEGRKRKRNRSLFSLLALLVIAGVGFGFFPGTGNSLFQKNVQTTLYARTEPGQEPDLDPEKYFSGENLDYEKFTFDLSGCDLEQPGTYQIPVLYEGKVTNVVMNLTVQAAEEEMAEDTLRESEQTYLNAG
ncbi:MAG: ty transcription activator TEC1 [Candidatus Limivivens sp.]|nr:ty transcription activator TEC1 [Candidatus Limivivens sp.]